MQHPHDTVVGAAVSGICRCASGEVISTSARSSSSGVQRWVLAVTSISGAMRRIEASLSRGSPCSRSADSGAGAAAAITHLPTAGLSAGEVVEWVEQLTDVALNLDDAVPVGLQGVGVTPRVSDARYATVQVLSTEARILGLAARGRRGSSGRVPLTALMPMGRDGRLDPSQHRAVLHLAGGGDLVSVLTAPAGAGKTSTPGAAAQACQTAGFRENLKVSTRQGCRFQSRQTFATVAKLTPSSVASSRDDQCVTPSFTGGLVNVATTISLCETVRGRPGRSRSSNAAKPPVSNRPRHSNTVGRLTPTSPAISVLLRRSAASNTIRARRARPDFNVEDRTQPSRVALSASEITNGAARIGIHQCLKNQL